MTGLNQVKISINQFIEILSSSIARREFDPEINKELIKQGMYGKLYGTKLYVSKEDSFDGQIQVDYVDSN